MRAELTQTTTGLPLVREIPADLETPIGVYLKLRGGGPSFLLESVEGGERIARYSFIGVEPRCQYVLRGRTIERRSANGVGTIALEAGEDPLHYLESELAALSLHNDTAQDEAARRGLPRFIGGLVGFLGYETVRYFEPKLEPRLAEADTPDAIFLLADTVVAFDHARRSLFLIAHPFDGEEAALRKLDALEARLRAPLPAPEAPAANLQPTFQSNRTQSEYEALVLAAKEHIAAGDIFQIQISQRFRRSTTAQPFDIYRAVRRLNPSPYMFYFEFGEVVAGGEPFYLVGASPEMFVRLEGRRASQRPIAGTRPRGKTPEVDAALEKELLADPKERAEHVMLVDLARNDLGRVCAYGSIGVPEFFVIERYSHVMHLVSHVEGLLRPGLTAFDLVRASFPAGTVTGAPKVRAMEIISDLEADMRGPYAGAVGYFGFDGAMDICLAIRTLVGNGQTVSVQAAAGIVADSNPTAEYQETVNKAKAMLKAVEQAEMNC
jgi:anthranilate synthase component 1